MKEIIEEFGESLIEFFVGSCLGGVILRIVCEKLFY